MQTPLFFIIAFREILYRTSLYFFILFSSAIIALYAIKPFANSMLRSSTIKLGRCIQGDCVECFGLGVYL